MALDYLINKASQHNIDIYEYPMNMTIKGLYADNVIWINRNIQTQSEKCCILAEELGHYHTSYGNILDQSQVNNRKQEKKARSWAYEYLISLSKIVQAHQAGVTGRYELADYLQVTEDFLQAAIDRYKEKFGPSTTLNHYIIYFDPLDVVERTTESTDL